jgi:hypothetical protein
VQREVRFVAERERRWLPAGTPCVSKPPDMDYDVGRADRVAEGERGPVLEYMSLAGQRRRVAAVRTPIDDRYGGDAVLVPDDGGARWVLCEVLP